MKLSNKQLIQKLKWLGVVSVVTNKPISYAAFKNRTTIVKYGKRDKVVFLGQPRKNLFGFYTTLDTDANVMKEAYKLFTDLVKGDMQGVEDKAVQWGNTGIPLGRRNLHINESLLTED